MKKCLILATLCLLSGGLLFAQTEKLAEKRKALAPAGDYYKGENVTMSWTLGQTFIDAYIEKHTMTQGFQQPYRTVPPQVVARDVQFLISPNPTAEMVKIYIRNSVYPDLWAQIYDEQGRFLKEQAIAGFFDQLSVTELPDGIYFISLTDKKDFVKTEKFIKIHY